MPSKPVLVESESAARQNYGFSEAIPFIAFAEEQADEHWVIIDTNNNVLARLSLWFSNKVTLEDVRAGFIGHYAATNEEAAEELLRHALAQLKNHGCQVAIGPLDGNTWRRYRFITERGSEPTYFLEPDNPDDYPQHFLNAGFTPLASYFSTVNNNLAVRDAKAAEIESDFNKRGITVRTFMPEQSDTELHNIFELSLKAFENNFLYSPIAEDEYSRKYRAVLPLTKPDLIFMVEHNGQLVGFQLAVPNWAEGKNPSTVILKTLARHPSTDYAGMGRLLVDKLQHIAHSCGYKRVIHALIYDDNISAKISRHYANPIRRYTLYSHRLDK